MVGATLPASALSTSAVAQAAVEPVDGSLADCKGPLFSIFESVIVGPIEAAAALIGEPFEVPEPGWEFVDSSNWFRSVTGSITRSKVTHTDFPVNHDSHDHNFDIDVDPGQEGLLSDVNPPNNEDDVGSVDDLLDPTKIEIEWETAHFPPWAWPSVGDRVWVDGNWIFDCGHAKRVGGINHYHTEIHPPRAVASMRDQLRTMPGTGTTPVRVTATDLYIHGRGGFVTEQLQCGLDVVIAPVPGCSQLEPLPHRGTPIDADFDFDVVLPPKPSSPTALLTTQIANGPGNTIGTAPQLTCCTSDDVDGNGTVDTLLHVRVPLAGTGAGFDDVFARRIYAGWITPPGSLHHFQLRLERGRMFEDQDTDPGDCDCTGFWMNVDRGSGLTTDREWFRLDAFDVPTDGGDCGIPGPFDDITNTLGHWDDNDGCGNGRLNFSGPAYDFYTSDSQSIRVEFNGYDRDCFDSVFGFPHEIFIQGMAMLACYADVFNGGDNDDQDLANQTFTAPGYGETRQASNSNYQMNLALTDLGLTNDEDTADLSATKTCAPNPVGAPGPFECIIRVRNDGPGLPRNVMVTDSLTGPAGVDPSEFRVDSASFAFQGFAAPPAACAIGAGADVFTCNLGTVPIGGTAVITTSISANQGGAYLDTAVVTTDSTDPHLSDNQAAFTETIIPRADLAMTKTDDPDPVLAGQNLTYTLTATNAGPSTAVDVAITDVLPLQTRFVSAAPSIGGACTTPLVGAGGTVTCTWVGDTVRGASRSVIVVVRVVSTGPIVDTAIASSPTEDPNLLNNAASATTEVVCTVTGTPGDDTLTGTPNDDVICGLGGDDRLIGERGNDFIVGGPGDDVLAGNRHDDELRGESGDDHLFGGQGDDLLFGGEGDDRIFGAAGLDAIDGGLGVDFCNPGSGGGTPINCE
jgi:uncharacterized repeat protein (TIGR01451 family)